MPTRSLILAAALSCAAVLILHAPRTSDGRTLPEQQRAPVVRPAAVRAAAASSFAEQEGASQPATKQSSGASGRAASGRAKKASGKSADEAQRALKVEVREVDETALAALLKRDATKNDSRPLLVNFWATWCDPCREEFPDLVRIDNEYRARGLEFITVSLDDVAEIGTAVPEFLVKMRAVRPAAYLLNANDPEAAILSVDKEWRGELPATFLFDARGQLVFKHMGRIKPVELRAALERVLKSER